MQAQINLSTILEGVLSGSSIVVEANSKQNTQFSYQINFLSSHLEAQNLTQILEWQAKFLLINKILFALFNLALEARDTRWLSTFNVLIQNVSQSGHQFYLATTKNFSNNPNVAQIMKHMIAINQFTRYFVELLKIYVNQVEINQRVTSKLEQSTASQIAKQTALIEAKHAQKSANLQNELKTLNSKMGQYISQQAKSKSQNDRLEKQLLYTQTMIQRKQSKIQQLLNTIESHNELKKKYVEQLSDKNMEINKLQDELNQNREALQHANEDHYKTRRKLAGMQQQNQKLSQNLHDVKLNFNYLEDQKQQIISQFKKQKEEYDKCSLLITEQTAYMRQISGVNSQLKQKIQSLDRTNKEKVRAIESLQMRLQQRDTAYTKLLQKSKSLKKATQDLKNQAQLIKKENVQLKQKILNSELDLRIEKLTTELKQKQQLIRIDVPKYEKQQLQIERLLSISKDLNLKLEWQIQNYNLAKLQCLKQYNENKTLVYFINSQMKALKIEMEMQKEKNRQKMKTIEYDINFQKRMNERNVNELEQQIKKSKQHNRQQRTKIHYRINIIGKQLGDLNLKHYVTGVTLQNLIHDTNNQINEVRQLTRGIDERLTSIQDNMRHKKQMKIPVKWLKYKNSKYADAILR